MPANPLCRVLVNGLPCGYQPDGKDQKEKLTNLFRHEREHLPDDQPLRISQTGMAALKSLIEEAVKVKAVH